MTNTLEHVLLFAALLMAVVSLPFLIDSARRLPIGTKSILFGVHQFLLHPLFMAAAWWKLFGFPRDPRLWVAFFVHDLGYWGKPNMDGPEGEMHVELGARIMHRLFDRRCFPCYTWGPEAECDLCGHRWRDFMLFHSRFYAKRAGQPFSKLCLADKQVFLSTPRWLYILLGTASGEIQEYMDRTRNSEKYSRQVTPSLTKDEWYDKVATYIGAWIAEHKDKTEDTWTKI